MVRAKKENHLTLNRVCFDRKIMISVCMFVFSLSSNNSSIFTHHTYPIPYLTIWTDGLIKFKNGSTRDTRFTFQYDFKCSLLINTWNSKKQKLFYLRPQHSYFKISRGFSSNERSKIINIVFDLLLNWSYSFLYV